MWWWCWKCWMCHAEFSNAPNPSEPKARIMELDLISTALKQGSNAWASSLEAPARASILSISSMICSIVCYVMYLYYLYLDYIYYLSSMASIIYIFMYLHVMSCSSFVNIGHSSSERSEMLQNSGCELRSSPNVGCPTGTQQQEEGASWGSWGRAGLQIYRSEFPVDL